MKKLFLSAATIIFSISVFSQPIWQPSGTNAVYTNRNVGIKTDIPTAALDVNGTSRTRGNATFDSSITALSVISQNASFATAVITGNITAGTLSTDVIQTSSGFLAIDINNRKLINASGNVKLDWEQGFLYNAAPSNVISLKWLSRELIGFDGATPSLNWGVRRMFDGIGTRSLDWENRYLLNADGNIKADWQQGILYNAPSSAPSLNWTNRELIALNGDVVINWENRKLQAGVWEYDADYSANFTTKSLVDKQYVDNKVASTPPPTLANVLSAGRDADATGTINDNSGNTTLDLNSRRLYNNGGEVKVDWQNGQLFNAPSSGLSIDWNVRQLYNSAGLIKIDWQNGYLYNDLPANTISVKWRSRELVDNDGITTNLNWATRRLQNNAWEYDADYSGSYSIRSLVDKEYVDNKIANSSWSAGSGQYSIMNNLAGGNSAQAQSSFIGAGSNNNIAPNSLYGIILGGTNNQLQNAAPAFPQYNIIGNGNNNITSSTAQYSFIGSGLNNKVEGKFGIVLSGNSNLNQSDYSFIGSGLGNNIYPNAQFGVILSGRNNTIQNAVAAGPADEDKFNFISSGSDNTIQSNAHHSSIIGGKNNIVVNGVENSVILGGTGITATQNNTVYAPNIVASGSITASSLSVSGQTQFDSLHVFNKIKIGNSIWLDGNPPTSPGTNEIYTDNGNLLIQSNPTYNFHTLINANNSGKVGIGTINPQSKLDVQTSGAINEIATNFSENTSRKIFMVPHLGSAAYNGLSQQDDIGIFWTDGLSSLGGRNETAGLVLAPWDHGTTIGLRITADGNVGIGTFCPTNKLEVKGTIRSQEWIVDQNNWCDFKFEPSYKRMTWQEKLAYIKEHKHLPEIAPESEISSDGLKVSKTLYGFVWNIEDNTMDIIDLQKENENLKNKNAELEKRIEVLEKTLTKK